MPRIRNLTEQRTGTSFATLSTASAIFNSLYSNGTCPSETAADGTVTRLACPEAYGYLLGTQVCAIILRRANMKLIQA